ncbi:MAG: transglycosylase domain-containing protein [Butyrivibrio sp.]|nr:transglycosylase domain-containing protein [Acetatifactor muris]MCM1560042.1 transglycosylase domain-containing protein [Butyrivibrio sp.]
MNYGKKGIRAQQRTLNSKTVKIERKILLGILKLSLLAFIGFGICGAAAGIGIFMGIRSSTPVIRLDSVIASGEATIVYDCAGNEIDQYVSSNSNRLRIESMDQLPDYLGKAFVAIEDERFYQHNGIDYKSMIRAGYQFLKTRGDETQGASTITQQLLKNTVFTTWTSEGKNMIKKIKRKLQEQYLAIELTKVYDKDSVLLEYMNAINLGQNTLGVEAASRRYFGKSASDLTVSEAAVIACITQNPSGYNPISHPEANAKRRERCLTKMLELDFITREQYEEAIADTEAVYARIGNYNIDYQENTNTTSGSYFSDALYEQVRNDLVNLAGLSEANAEKLLTAGGLRIFSTLDPTIQAIADEEIANPENFPENVDWYLNYALTVKDAEGTKHNYSKENMMTWFKKNVNSQFNLIFSSQEEAYEAIETYRAAVLEEMGIANVEDNYEESVSMTPQPQAAVVISDQSTGYVVAIIGGRGTKEGRRTLNRATKSTRQPGSTFKVLATYAPALDSAGQTLATVYNDAPFNYDDGTPVRNSYSRTSTPYKGIQSIRAGISQSINILAVKTTTVITPQLGYDYLLNFGFTTLVESKVINNQTFTDIRQPIALGGLTDGVTPYELNAAYASIANLGTYVEPKLYIKVEDTDGNIILDNTTPKTKRVLKATTAYLLTSAMMDTMVSPGTGPKARFSNTMATAGKSGTTTGPTDVWFTGFTPYYTCTIWTGYDNNVHLKNSDTSKFLWKAIMYRIHENLPDQQFEVPEGLVSARVCSRSGLLPIPGLCDEWLKTEIFAEGTVPTESCSIHYEGNICAYDGLPATPLCPFPVYGKLERPLIEDPALLNGSTMITTNPDGTQTITTPPTSGYCQHDDTFFANPDWLAIQNAQQVEIEQRNAAAAAAAAAAADTPAQ